MDVSGLTKEFFSLFWKTLSSKVMYGAKELYIQSKPDLLYDSVDYEIFGRILVHGYILTGYLPIRLNNATLYHVLTGRKPSKDILKSSFLNCLSRADQDLVVNALTKPDTVLSSENHDLLMSLMSRFGCTTYLSSSNVLKNCEAIANFTAIKRTYFIVSHTRRGVLSPSIQNCSRNLGKETFNVLLLHSSPMYLNWSNY